MPGPYAYGRHPLIRRFIGKNFAPSAAAGGQAALQDYIFFRQIHITSASIPQTTMVNTA